MTLDDINNIQMENCEKFSDFASSKMPMPGTKKRIEQILGRDIVVVDFRVTESKHRQNSKCLQIQFLMDGVVHVVFTGSVVLLDQIQYSKDKIPFKTKITKNDNYYSLS